MDEREAQISHQPDHGRQAKPNSAIEAYIEVRLSARAVPEPMVSPKV
jgi:hypothetical protein